MTEIALLTLLGISSAACIYLVIVGLTGYREHAVIQSRLRRRFASVAFKRQTEGSLEEETLLSQDTTFGKSLEKILGQRGIGLSRLRNQIRAAGWKIGLLEYGLFSLLCGFGAFVAASFSMELIARFAPIIGILGIFWIPKTIINYLANKRQLAFLKQFAEALDMIVRSIRSGQPVTKALEMVAQEMKDPLASEFKFVTERLKIGVPLEVSLSEAADRVGIIDFRFFSIALIIQKQTGGSLADTLSNLSSIVRRRQELRLKIRALSSEARTSALIIGALPIVVWVVLSILNPDYLSDLKNTASGQRLLGFGIGGLVTGLLVIRRMIRFEH